MFAAATAGAVEARIVNGLPSQDFPTTGALLYSQSSSSMITASNARTWCSGTLIGCQTFLVAAHCVSGDSVASHYWVYLQHGGIATLSSITINPTYVAGFSGHDVAVIKLASQVTGIDPTTINSTHDLVALGLGLPGTIAGFGRTGGGSDYGIKYYGAIVTADCDTSETNGEGNNKLVCWDYDSSVGPAGEDSNTCNGDSGGPLFMDFSGATELVGVTSAGVATNCLPVDHSWDASVYYNRTWIASQIGVDSTASCGSILPVGDPSVAVYADSGTLNSVHPSDSYEINLTGSPDLVRFTLNGNDVGFNPNFFVKQGSGASASSYDCKADGASAVGDCPFDNPANGTWSIFVQRGSGAGKYQVTTTVFGGDPPVCGNDIIEGVEACDGSADAACPGVCQVDCTCPLVCGSGDLASQSIICDADRFNYKAWLYDPVADYAALDPREDDFTLDITDGSGSVSMTIPTADAGWVKADPLHRKYGWKGDGTLYGLRRVRLVYKDVSPEPYWYVVVRGKSVPGAGTVDPWATLDVQLGIDSTCNVQTWQ